MRCSDFQSCLRTFQSCLDYKKKSINLDRVGGKRIVFFLLYFCGLLMPPNVGFCKWRIVGYFSLSMLCRPAKASSIALRVLVSRSMLRVRHLA